MYFQPSMPVTTTNNCQSRLLMYSKACKHFENCINFYCPFTHPPGRLPPCYHGLFCLDFDCKLLHPLSRPLPCLLSLSCGNQHCPQLHPDGWDPFKVTAFARDVKLKVRSQREVERKAADLTIWYARHQFCELLKRHKVLIVTAETGSGKTTQLAQYAAEIFENDNKLIICTQPRGIAAMSIARRVALEFDGKSVGYSVGYQIGSTKKVNGTRMMFMTDSSVIYESQKHGRSAFFQNVGVLIIDEAHERSLSTDIVLGLAKLCLDDRPNDFYVVVSSATIEPKEFYRFFNCSHDEQHLDVPGSKFEVLTDCKPSSSAVEDLISNVKEALEKYTEGHALVFLPGQNEIENAIKEFRKDISQNCIPMALYGQMSIEEQNEVIQFEGEENERIVVFCTNIAETSLTIPNVRLVIDSGWAKEGRYDSKRHVNIIELVRISKSSAKQRKGRAGRTAHGHYIQLYEDESLERENIEPEILRSSLDLVVLQLIGLDFNPLRFPYVTKPTAEMIEMIANSKKLLVDLRCIDEYDKLTSKGILFSQLEFDPRLSEFILHAAESYQKLHLAGGIASILSAEKNLFYFGSLCRKDVHARIIEESAGFDSDIIFLLSVYKKWKNVQCQCSYKVEREFCRICRVNYSDDKGLNNRILEMIDRQTDYVYQTISKYLSSERPYEERIENDDENSKVIGICLQKAFCEQLGHVLVRHLPNRGVRLLSRQVDHIRANIVRTSVFFRTRSDPFYFFIAMSITRLSNGKYLVDRLHPISVGPNLPFISEQDKIIVVHELPNVGAELNKLIESSFQDEKKLFKEKREYYKWIIYEYIPSLNLIQIHAPIKYRSDLVSVFSRLHVNCRAQMLKKCKRISLPSGVVTATFQGGLDVLRIDDYRLTYKLILYDIPPKNEEELEPWLSRFGINMNATIKQPPRFGDNNSVQLIFNKEDPLLTLRSQAPNNLQSPHIEEPLFTRQLMLITPGNIYANDVKQYFHPDKIHLAKKIERLYQISIENLENRDSPETILSQCSISPKKIYTVGKTMVINFIKVEDRDEAFEILLQKLPKTVTLTECNSPSRTKFILTYITSEIAKSDSKISKIPDHWTLSGYASVTVFYEDSYKDLKVTLSDICDKVNVRCDPKMQSNIETNVIFYHEKIEYTTNAAFLLTSALTPLKLNGSSDRLRRLYNEILSGGHLDKWLNELNLTLKPKSNAHEIVIYGSSFEQGLLWEKLESYAKSFNDRYYHILLDSDTLKNLHFNKDLKNLITKWSKKYCSIYLQSNKLEICASHKDDKLQCVKEINQFLQESGIKYFNKKLLCDFCKCESTTCDTLLICGHRYCDCILDTEYYTFPIRCEQCREMIHIDDLEKMFSRKGKDELYKVCKKKLETYLVEKEQIVFCYNKDCDSLMLKIEGYHSCAACEWMMCFDCKVYNNPQHLGLTCNERLARINRMEFLRDLMIAARKFLSDSWLIGIPRKETDNPYLKHGCASFDHFFSHYDRLSISDGKFAFHAASEHRVDRICQEGFRPDNCRLRLLKDVPRITFHHRADVAFGFSEDKYASQLILTFLLKGEQIDELPGHGFQLKQRSDWTSAYELPLLIVLKI